MPANTPPHDEKTLRVGIFFDGTGNHKHPITAEKGPTNIAALHDLYAADQSSIFSIYVKGIGLYEVQGKGGGSGVRIDPLSLATGLGRAGGHARMAEAAEGLLNVLARRAPRPSARIVLDVFGFSRGAALARHFVNAVLLTGLPDPRREVDATAVPRVISPNLRAFKGKGYARLDCPVEIGFLGLFDTVGSFGLPGNADEGDFDVALPAAVVAKTRHLTAADEYRRNFPLRSIYDNALNTGNEEACPGAHADIGGGYPPPGPENEEHILAAVAEVSVWRGARPSVHVFQNHPPELEALLKRILKDWPAAPSPGLIREIRQRHGLELRRATQTVTGEDETVVLRFFKKKRTQHALQYVYLQKMLAAAAAHGAPFRPPPAETLRRARAAEALRERDFNAFWEEYIHLSAVADTRYSASWTVNAEGRVVLRPGLARDLLPKSKHVVDGVYLVDGMQSAGRRTVFNNSFKQRRPRNEH